MQAPSMDSAAMCCGAQGPHVTQREQTRAHAPEPYSGI